MDLICSTVKLTCHFAERNALPEKIDAKMIMMNGCDVYDRWEETTMKEKHDMPRSQGER